MDGSCLNVESFQLITQSSVLNPQHLLIGDDEPLRARGQGSEFAAREARVREHAFEFGVCVGVSAGRAREHREAEGGGDGRRDSVIVGHELKCQSAAAVFERRADFAQERLAGRRVEVVQEVRQKHYVVAFAEVCVEGAALNRVVALGDSGGARVLLRHFEHGGPVERVNGRLRKASREGYAVEAVARRYGFNVVGLIETTPEIAPSARHLAELKQTARNRALRAILAEAGERDPLAEELAIDLGVALVRLDTVETGRAVSTAYEDAVKRNVAALEGVRK